MNDRDISIGLLDKAAFMREGVKFCGKIFDKEVWLVKDKTVEDFLRRPSAKSIQSISPAQQQARAELRDRFAMAALTGMKANPNSDGTQYDYAKWAYEYADAMLKAREENSQ